MFPYGGTVTRLRRRTVLNPYSGQHELGPWDTADAAPIHGVAFDQQVSTEPASTDGTARVVTTTVLLGPPGTDLRAGDRIVDPSGRVWDVDGDVFAPVNPFTGWAPGVQASLRAVKG